MAQARGRESGKSRVPLLKLLLLDVPPWAVHLTFPGSNFLGVK